MRTTIRQATPDDCDELCRVLQEGDQHHSQALPHVFRTLEPGEDVRSQDYLRTIIADEYSTIFVAERTSEITGALHVTIRQSPAYPIMVPRRFAVIENLIVVHAHRRKGIGKALMVHAHQWAAEHGVSQIELNVWNFNEDAIRFCERLGYETASRRMWMTIPPSLSAEG